jgi:hypothetical protein
MELHAGTRYRFRVINIRAEAVAQLALLNGDTPVTWRTVARDGADLPTGQQMVGPAALTFAAGQIYDFEFTPAAAGPLTLRFGDPTRQFPDSTAATMAVTVR